MSEYYSQNSIPHKLNPTGDTRGRNQQLVHLGLESENAFVAYRAYVDFSLSFGLKTHFIVKLA